RWSVGSDPVPLDRVRLVGPLLEMDLPGKPAVPSRQSFAGHLKINCVVGMENQNESRQPIRSDSIGKVSRGTTGAVPVFLDVQIAMLHFLNGYDIIELALFRRRGEPIFADRFMRERFGRGEAIHVLH